MKKFVVRNYPIMDYDVKLVNSENITANPYGRRGNKIFVKKSKKYLVVTNFILIFVV